MNEHKNKGVAHEQLPLSPLSIPKKHTIGPDEGQLHVGALVFYRNERYWISICPPNWEKTHYVRICSKRVRVESPEPTDAECFAVHPDALDLVMKAQKNPYSGRAPTIKSIARAERTKSGQHDVGDVVAEILRPLTLEQMFETAANYLRVPLDELLTKYAHLDNGRKRMVIGNRLRSEYRKRETN